MELVENNVAKQRRIHVFDLFKNILYIPLKICRFVFTSLIMKFINKFIENDNYDEEPAATTTPSKGVLEEAEEDAETEPITETEDASETNITQKPQTDNECTNATNGNDSNEESTSEDLKEQSENPRSRKKRHLIDTYSYEPVDCNGDYVEIFN